MRTTVAQMLPKVAANMQDSGLCLTAESLPNAVSIYNDACYALWTRIDEGGTLWEWDVPACDGCFALPADCLDARQMWLNGVTLTQRNQWYQGKIACSSDCGTNCYGPDVIDMGEFAIPLPITAKIRGIRAAFVAQSDADAGVEVDFIVTDEYGESKRQTVSLLGGQEPVMSDNVVYDLTFLKKPKTHDNVKLFWQFDNGQRIFVADYGPEVQIGTFRRKRLPQRFCGCNMVRIKGKRQFYEITDAEDISFFDNWLAMSWACSAIAALRRQDAGSYQTFLQNALNEINKQMRNANGAAYVTQASFRSGYGCNPSQAANRPLPGTALYGGWGWGGGR